MEKCLFQVGFSLSAVVLGTVSVLARSQAPEGADRIAGSFG